MQQSSSSQSIDLSATAPLREPLRLMARQYASGVKPLRFQSILILNTR